MLTYFTDGSCSPNPGPGGFAVIEDRKPVVLGREKDSTNIRMEGEALIAAMKYSAGKQSEIHTDSEFWIKVITEWAPGWEAKGWKKSSKGEIQNLDLVKRKSWRSWFFWLRSMKKSIMLYNCQTQSKPLNIGWNREALAERTWNNILDHVVVCRRLLIKCDLLI